MLERSERALKILCAALAVLVLYQLGRMAITGSPLAHVTIPALPSLPAAPAAQAGGKGTNPPPAQAAAKPGTNSAADSSALEGTNSRAHQAAAKAGSNSLPPQLAAKTETNAAARDQAAKGGTNSVPEPASAKGSTNGPVLANRRKGGTNSVARRGSGAPGMNTGPGPGMAMPGMNPGFGPGPGMKRPELPPAIKARVDRITESEILAPVMRPLPMALLGIAGKDAFLRAPNGQTGLVKEGEELGGIKLLRIGINRVLIEEQGQKKELTIFSGYGGESLLAKEKENP